MSLATTDIQQIRTVVREEVRSETSKQLQPLGSGVKALRSDIKEIYDMLYSHAI